MLLDTSGLLCFLFDREPEHQRAVHCFTTARTLFSHTLVLAELIALCSSRKYDRNKCLDFVSELLLSEDVEIVIADKSLLQRGVTLLQQREDKVWSLCDAVSFNLMQDHGITDALTTDHHFTQARFNVLLKN